MLLLLSIILCLSMSLGFINGQMQCLLPGDNAVEMKFYRTDRTKFLGEQADLEVEGRLASHAIAYCTTDASTCGVTDCTNFNSSHVITVSGYPKNEQKNLLHKVNIRSPENTSCAVASRYVKAVIERAREDIHEATGYWITYIDDDFYGIPPPATMNAIIMPIASAFVLGLAIVTFSLRRMSKKREAEARRLKHIKLKHVKSISRPSSETKSVSTRDSRPPAGRSSARTRSSKKDKKKDKKERRHSRENSRDRHTMEAFTQGAAFPGNVRSEKSESKGITGKHQSVVASPGELNMNTTDGKDKDTGAVTNAVKNQGANTEENVRSQLQSIASLDSGVHTARNTQLVPIDPDALSTHKKKKLKRRVSEEERTRRKFRKMIHSMALKHPVSKALD